MSVVELKPGHPIPAPPNFPLNWPTPEAAAGFWKHDRMHFPDPMPTLSHYVWSRFLSQGFTHAFLKYEMPLVRHESIRFNTYHYEQYVPRLESPAEQEARLALAQAKIGAVVARLDEVWQQEWLPKVQAALGYWEAFDLKGAPMDELLKHFAETLRLADRLGEVHFEIIVPMLVAMNQFHETHADLFGDEGELDSMDLLQGLDNISMAMGRALWNLRSVVVTIPEVRRNLERLQPAEFLATLEESELGRAFRAELDAFLQKYGHRGDKWDFSGPLWIEDPAPVIRMLKEYLLQPESDPAEALATKAAKRDRLVEAARTQLAAYPLPVRENFEILLKAAQTGVMLQEDHNYWIDFRSMAAIREVLLEFGRRFAQAGLLESPHDIMHLTPDELRETARTGVSRKELAAERKAELEYWRQVTPPPLVGTLPPGPPPGDPISRAVVRFFGADQKPAADPALVTGTPGSKGLVRGRARVVQSLADAQSLQPGEVLVCGTTAPGWTPLFRTAAAVVTDVGGVLSHCAIVAREYEVPAVVGTGTGTQRIRTGQTVEVDGTAGTVRILD